NREGGKNNCDAAASRSGHRVRTTCIGNIHQATRERIAPKYPSKQQGYANNQRQQKPERHVFTRSDMQERQLENLDPPTREETSQASRGYGQYRPAKIRTSAVRHRACQADRQRPLTPWQRQAVAWPDVRAQRPSYVASQRSIVPRHHRLKMFDSPLEGGRYRSRLN